MALNVWFKHYNKAHEGQSIFTLWASGRGELVGFYWTLLELVSLWEDPKFRGTLRITSASLCRKFSTTTRKLRRMLSETSIEFQIKITEVSPEFWEIIVPNWLELQENRGGKRVSNENQKDSKNPIEARGEKGDGRGEKKDLGKEISELVSLWGETLKKFKISKDPQLDEIAIAGLLSRHKFEKARLAIIGQRYEQQTDSFDPGKHVSVLRLMNKPEIFEKLVNLGAQEQPPEKSAYSHLPD